MLVAGCGGVGSSSVQTPLVGPATLSGSLAASASSITTSTLAEAASNARGGVSQTSCEPPPVQSLEVTAASLTLTSANLTSQFTACTQYQSTYTITVSPSGVVSVPSSVTPSTGTNGIKSAIIAVTALASGNATITVTDKNGTDAKVLVTVTPGSPTPSPSPTAAPIPAPTPIISQLLVSASDCGMQYVFVDGVPENRLAHTLPQPYGPWDFQVTCTFSNSLTAATITVSIPTNHEFANVNLGDTDNTKTPPLQAGFGLITAPACVNPSLCGSAYTGAVGQSMTLSPGTETFILPTAKSACTNTIPNITIRQTGEAVQGTFCDHIARVALSSSGRKIYTLFTAGDEIGTLNH